MNYTQDFLRQIAARAGVRPTAYAIHQHMTLKYGWSRSTVFNYWRGTTAPDDTKALDIAAELELNTLYVIACVNMDRVGDAESRKSWEAVAQATRNIAAGVILSASVGLVALAGMFGGSAAYAATGSGSLNQTGYTLRALLRRLAEWLGIVLEEADGLELA